MISNYIPFGRSCFWTYVLSMRFSRVLNDAMPIGREVLEDKVLQGKWKLVHRSSNMKELDTDDNIVYSCLITDKEIVTAKDGKETQRTKYRVDPTKTPKWD